MPGRKIPTVPIILPSPIPHNPQSFIAIAPAKVEKLKALINKKNATTVIEIDGGVTNKNAKQLADAGADVLVAGSYVFGAQDPIATIADLKQVTKK
jgi:ribulose-phosphate 3-epimerase